MKGLVITNPGLEAVSAKEVKDLIGVDSTVEKSVSLFETGNIEDFCVLCYRAQSAYKVLALLGQGKLGEDALESILKIIKECDFSEWLKNKTFAVRAKIVNNDMLDTLETERLVGEIIHDKLSTKVNLEDPDVTVFVYIINNVFYAGIDFAGFDLSKRKYRVFGLNDSIKGTVAYSLVRVAGYKPDKILLDPFCHSGTIAIETATYASNKPIRFYDKEDFAFMRFPQFENYKFDLFFEKQDAKTSMDSFKINSFDAQQRFLRSTEKNAKIAGVNKLIHFSRTEVEWLDTKFEKQSVDMIVSNPPRISRSLSEKGLDKVFQELFYTADFILKKDGKIVLLVKSYQQILNHAGRYNFDLKANFEIMQGQEELHILVLEKN